MSDFASSPIYDALHPPAVAVRSAWPWAILAGALLMLVYMVGVNDAAVAFVPDHYSHEFFHDGRHLLAFPCH